MPLRMLRVLIASVVLIASCAGGAQDQAVKDSIEWQLAVIDAGGYVDTSDSIVGVYRRALTRAESKCDNSTRQIGDMAVKSTELLADYGVQATTLEMVQALNEYVDGTGGADCANAFALLVVLLR